MPAISTRGTDMGLQVVPTRAICRCFVPISATVMSLSAGTEMPLATSRLGWAST